MNNIERKALRLWNELTEDERQMALLLVKVRPQATREHVVRALGALLRKSVPELPEVLREQSQAFLEKWTALSEHSRGLVLSYIDTLADTGPAAT